MFIPNRNVSDKHLLKCDIFSVITNFKAELFAKLGSEMKNQNNLY